jgi:hypothetical protein
MTHIHTQEIQTLQTLPEQINREHQQAEQAARSALTHALKAGELLLQAKQQCAYGDWQAWIQQHCQFAERTARLYMQLARETAFCTEPEWQRVADLPLRQALKCLVPPPSLDLEAEGRALDDRLKRCKQQQRLLELAYESAQTIEDYHAVSVAAEELVAAGHEIKIRALTALGTILNDVREAPPWQQAIFKIIRKGGESAQAAFQAIDERIQELEQEEICGQPEGQA